MLEEAKLLEDDYDTRVSKRSWGTSINIGGTSFATSLFWQPLQNLEDPFQEVEDASEGVLEGADLFCIKGGKAPQFGICVSHEGFKSGDPVAAVALATAMSNTASYIAVFKTNQGWWYTCIRNDIILSDGDMLFLSEDEAKSQFSSMLAVPDWGKKIAPAEWGLEDTETMDLADLLAKGAKSKLQKIKALRGAKLLLVIAISTIVGLWLLSSLVNHLFLTPTIRPVIVPVKPKTTQQLEQPVEIKPWEKLYDPAQVISSCYHSIQSLVKIMPPGWIISALDCQNGAVSTSWRREIGRLSWMKKALDDSGLAFSSQSFSNDGSTLSITLPLPEIRQLNLPPMKTMVDLKNEINDLFQSIGVPVNVGEMTYTSPQGNIYKMLTFGFSSRYNPLIWNDLLMKFSGLEIKSINYSPSSKIWDYEGAVYVL